MYMWDVFKSEEIWQIGAAIITIIGGLFILVPKAHRIIVLPIYRWWKNLLLAPLILADIRNQVYNNGGGSLKDSVDHIKQRLYILEHQFKAKSLLEPDAKYWADKTGRTIAINTAFARLFKCQVSDVKDFNFMKLIPVNDAESVFKSWLRSVELGADFQQAMELNDVDGNSIGIVDVHAIAIKDVDGNVLEYEGLVKPRCIQYENKEQLHSQAHIE